jgi:lactase-phlorizin hydrolase
MILFQLDTFRFSIAWTRIMPTGTINSLNQEGINFYNNVINEIIKNDITPMVRSQKYSEI